MKLAPDPKDTQEFQFKQSTVHQILDSFTVIPPACNLIVADVCRGLLYIGHNNKLTVLKPGNDEESTEWKLEHNLPVNISQLALNCDCSYLAVTSQSPIVLIYDVTSLSKNDLEILHKIRVSKESSMEQIFVFDVKWNPCFPGMLCTVASDGSVGSFQVKVNDQKVTVGLAGLEKPNGLDARCLAWSPKGKQIVIGCRNGSIVQLKPDLKIARLIPGPEPNIGEVISLLWISNYQFCAAYLNTSERHFNVLIVDAPKGKTTANFTNYEDITYALLGAEGESALPRYYFDHIPEWGLIIAGSSGSSEIALLATTDSGVTWCQWQPVDSGRAQLPLIGTIESYPVGFAIDKSPVEKLPWGAESTLPNPVPILHIFSTSGQLCSFHMVNLLPNCPVVCSAPIEIVLPPQTAKLPDSRLSIAPSELSFALTSAVTSTPRPSNPTEITCEHPKAAPVANLFSEPAKPTELPRQIQSNELKAHEVEKPATIIESDELNTSIAKTQVQETQEQEEAKEKICMQDFIREKEQFEKELHEILEPQLKLEAIGDCGTFLVDKCIEIDNFIKDLRKETNNLSSSIAYLKTSLLQSFAWVEKTKSRNAVNSNITTRGLEESSRIAELKKRYYYTQNQLIQATKALDLKWSDHRSDEQSKMRIPSTEYLYQTLIKQNDIINKEREKLECLRKKLRLIIHPSSSSGLVSDLNQSMSSLNISPKETSPLRPDSEIIQARCKAIAIKTLAFTNEKQAKLKRLLAQSSPKIIKPINPATIPHRPAINTNIEEIAPLDESKQQSTKEINEQQPQEARQDATAASTMAKLSQAEQRTSAMPILTQSLSKPSTTITFGKPDTTSSLANALKPQNKTESGNFGMATLSTQEVLQQKPLSSDIIFKTNTPQMQALQKLETLFSSANYPLTTEAPTLTHPTASSNSPSMPAIAAMPPLSALSFLSKTAAAISTAAPSATPQGLPQTAPILESKLTMQAPQRATPQATLDFSALSFGSQQNAGFANMAVQSPPKGATSTTASTINFGKASPLPASLLNLTASIQNAAAAQAAAAVAASTINMNIFSKALNVASPTSATAITTSTTTASATTVAPKPVLNVPSFTGGTTAQAQNSTLFGGQSTAGVVPAFGKLVTSPTASATFTPSTPIAALSSFGKAITTTAVAPSTNAFGAVISTTPLTADTSTTTTTSSTKFENNAFVNNLSTSLTFGTPTTTTATATIAPSFFTPTSKSSAETGKTSASEINFANAISSSSTASTFGNANTPTTIAPAFGKVSPATSVTAATTSVTTPPTDIFGKAAISSTAQPSSPFGSNTMSQSIFGGTTAQQSSSPSIFSGNSAGSNLFKTPATTASSIFGAKPAMTASMFGGNTSASSPAFGTPSTMPSVFDNNAQKTANAPSFAAFASPPATGQASIFGSASSNVTPAVGGSPSFFGGSTTPVITGSPTSPAFGASPAFGSKPVFGSPPGGVFGNAKSVFGGGFATTAFGGSPTSTGFGSAPAMGGSPPPMGSNTPKVFGSTTGSTTFESLAGQTEGFSFGSLAQKTAEPEKPPSFGGGSSFSTWR
ncbi:nuclear pore complex protein Nup214 isoform X2 [Prorops nasuta]|uniref:nuclear pore complex protein Nup214 isoform X2 n=1 Tax=Prorops nasuta TaxID=863751 RepID=UPI0034CD208F